jgi:hypothetical protein
MSRFDVTLLEEAVEDVLIGKQFYEEIEEGVGVYFAASALADITSLSIYAGIHSSYFGYFRLLMKRFPFAVYYQKEQNQVEVIAVLDMRRNPKTLRAILANRKSQPSEDDNG